MYMYLCQGLRLSKRQETYRRTRTCKYYRLAIVDNFSPIFTSYQGQI